MIGELTNIQIDELLKRNVLGRIGCNDDKNIYVVPVSYAFDGRYIIAHSVMGLKIEMMRKNPKVCFEVDEVKHFNCWQSVIAQGEYQELTDEEEKYHAMKLFVDRMLHIKLSETAIPPEMSEKRIHPRSAGNIHLVVYRILITEMSGRYENT